MSERAWDGTTRRSPCFTGHMALRINPEAPGDVYVELRTGYEFPVDALRWCSHADLADVADLPLDQFEEDVRRWDGVWAMYGLLLPDRHARVD